jgi:hypothetical protein
MVRASGDGGGGQETVLVMTEDAVRRARRLYDGVGEVCQGVADEIPDGYAVVTQACGAFFAQIDPGITAFTASWETALMLTADEARLIAANVHEVSTRVTDLDRTLTGGMLWATTS